MTGPKFTFIPVLDHEIHVSEWGTRTNPPIVMWHGLARTGRDFDELAHALSDRFFVLCPDMIGRGLSTWSADPDREYSVEHYAKIATALLDHYAINKAGWIGTSLGGLMGMRIASGPLAERLMWLILNDIGPEIPQPTIDRILTYTTEPPVFHTINAAEEWFRAVYAPFGAAADTYWHRMARTSVRRLENGKFSTHFDLRITVQFSKSPAELTSWDRFERIQIPVHAIAGQQSDILTGTILARMKTSGPRPESTIIPNCGHAPSLARPADIKLIRAIISERF